MTLGRLAVSPWRCGIARGGRTTELVADRVYYGILELIERGEIRPSHILSHRKLAERLGSSKLSVATALQRLEHEGLVASVPRVGTRLLHVDTHALWGWLQWRLAIECQAARHANQWMLTDDRRQLVELGRRADDALAEMEAARESVADDHHAMPHTREGRHPDIDFHAFLAGHCGCDRLGEELKRLNIFRIKFSLCEAAQIAQGPPPVGPPGHTAVAAAIVEGTPAHADAVMRDHLEQSGKVCHFMAWYAATYRPDL